MRRYESYKDSGVEWLGEVPSHWESFPLFVQAKISSITNHIDKELLSVYLDRGVVRFSDVDEKRTNVTSLDLSKYQLVRKGNLVLNNQQAWRGSVGVSSYEGIVSPAYLILELSNKFDPHYANYLFRNSSMVSHYLIASKGVGTIQRNLYWGNLRRTPIFIPPLSEQQKIAQFLDDKTAKIDQALDLAEKQIALLKEHKQILIQNAVTRGLNPDVPLKDSGVEWIGQVPEHWEVKRFRNLFDFGKGLSITKENLQDEGIPCVNYGEIHSKYGFEVIPERDALKCVDSKYLVFKNSMLNKGDFVFADTSEDIEGSGNFTYLNSSTRIFAGYHTVITRLKITAIHRYIAYYFDSLSFRNQIRNEVKGVKVFSITQSILKGTFMLLPNLKEQQQIANYLDTQTAKIDQAIALKTAHIEKLKEYKSVLINDVVTGKVRVSV